MLCEITHVTMWVVQLTIEDGVHSFKWAGDSSLIQKGEGERQEGDPSLVPRPHPLTKRNGLVN